MVKAKEPQNQVQIDIYNQRGPFTMGPWTSHIARTDPRHLAFLLSRYKFCAKMLAGKKKVLEIGCGDAFGLPIVLQAVASVHGVDFKPLVLENARERFEKEGFKGVTFSVHDMTQGPLSEKFDAVYSLDVIEHISPHEEKLFMSNICSSLNEHGVCIIGTPNITAEKYTSEASREGHINLKSAKTLHDLLSQFFYNAFDFSMNDEVVHTGYAPMAHYILGMGVGVKK